MGFKPDLNDQLVSFSALKLLVGHLACKNHPRNDLLCVEWDVKPYTLTHTLTIPQLSFLAHQMSLFAL